MSTSTTRTGALIGYARVSSSSQSLEQQQAELAAAGCLKVFSEKRSGTTTKGREALEDALDYCREGDVFVVTRLDRLARSVGDLHGIVDRLTAKGVGFKALQQAEIDTTSITGRMLLGILSVFAAFETDLRRERQLEGIAQAKAKGVYKGRPRTKDAAAVVRLRAAGEGPGAIAKQLGMSRSTVQRLLREASVI